MPDCFLDDVYREILGQFYVEDIIRLALDTRPLAPAQRAVVEAIDLGHPMRTRAMLTELKLRTVNDLENVI